MHTALCTNTFCGREIIFCIIFSECCVLAAHIINFPGELLKAFHSLDDMKNLYCFIISPLCALFT